MLSRDSLQTIRAERRAGRLKCNVKEPSMPEFGIRVVNKPILTVSTLSVTVRLRHLWHGRSYASASIARNRYGHASPSSMTTALAWIAAIGMNQSIFGVFYDISLLVSAS
ncbi:Uncharacterized protein BM_BM17557 [Brugia malayi]|uniref:Uncharacterized protein n=1 Tax=Brugia malayi TaxID=6279 RepID=A0A4E9FEY4_BRUMA|nr:Uncharacterized protein BM_BM17557 [Brugia malayi]VIO94896.1 Uncharacterized protein BM_BM17557 [Brugia malayi]